MKNLSLKEAKTRPRSHSQVNDGARVKAPSPEAQSCATCLVSSSLGASKRRGLQRHPTVTPGGRSIAPAPRRGRGPASRQLHHSGHRLYGDDDVEETPSLCFMLLGDRGPRAPASLCGGARRRRRHRPPPKWSEAPRSADGPEGSLPHPPAARAPATSPRGQAPCGTASSVRLLLSAPSPSFPPGVWRDTNPPAARGAGTASQGAGLWLQTLSSQVTNNTMSPGNEFVSNKEVSGEDEGAGPCHGRCGSASAGILGGRPPLGRPHARAP